MPKSHFTDYLKHSSSENIMLLPATEIEVLNKLNNLYSSKSAVVYDIPISLIQIIKNEITCPLVTLINLYLSSGCFLKSFKYAKVSNYPPTSILLIFYFCFSSFMV